MAQYQYTPVYPPETAYTYVETLYLVGWLFDTEGVAFNESNYLFNYYEADQDTVNISC